MTCVVCGADGPNDVAAASRAGWNWFTGYLSQRAEFCPTCKDSKERHTMFIKSREEKQTSRIKILFRKNLHMTPGKLAAQCCHAALALPGANSQQSVVVLGVSDTKFEQIKEDRKALFIALVRDAGYTEVAPLTETVMAFFEDDPRENASGAPLAGETKE